MMHVDTSRNCCTQCYSNLSSLSALSLQSDTPHLSCSLMGGIGTPTNETTHRSTGWVSPANSNRTIIVLCKKIKVSDCFIYWHLYMSHLYVSFSPFLYKIELKTDMPRLFCKFIQLWLVEVLFTQFQASGNAILICLETLLRHHAAIIFG